MENGHIGEVGEGWKVILDRIMMKHYTRMMLKLEEENKERRQIYL